jgi:hypothetical protein
MTIKLRDIRTAVEDYLNSSVSVTVTELQPDPTSPGTINPNEHGTFEVLVVNTGEPDGVPMTNVRLHLTFKKDSAGKDTGAKFIAPATTVAVARDGTSDSSAVLKPGDSFTEMVLFPPNNALEVPGLIALPNLVAVAPGRAGIEVTIQCHVHAEADQAFLFPPGERGKNGTSTFKVE